jgi:signal transduction histidine kinase
VRFAVRDTGHGIASDRLHAVFDRFTQASSDRRGLGLGLYISRSIIEAHGGRMSVVSQLGEGSEFTFDVPAAPAPAR